MTDTAPTDSPEIADRLKQITDYVRDCERRVHLGEVMDLQGLDDNVKDLCEDLAKLPQQEAQKMESSMSVLIEGLELLADAMRAQEEKLSGGKGA